MEAIPMLDFVKKHSLAIIALLAFALVVPIVPDANGAPDSAGRIPVLLWALGSSGSALQIGGSTKAELKTASRAFTAPGAPVVVTLPTDGGYACIGPAGDGGTAFCGNPLAMSAGDTVRVSCNEAAGDTYYLLGTGTVAGSAVTTSTGNILPDRAVERMILTSGQTSIGFATAATTGTPKCRVAVVGEVP